MEVRLIEIDNIVYASYYKENNELIASLTIDIESKQLISFNKIGNICLRDRFILISELHEKLLRPSLIECYNGILYEDTKIELDTFKLKLNKLSKGNDCFFSMLDEGNLLSKIYLEVYYKKSNIKTTLAYDVDIRIVSMYKEDLNILNKMNRDITYRIEEGYKQDYKNTLKNLDELNLKPSIELVIYDKMESIIENTEYVVLLEDKYLTNRNSNGIHFGLNFYNSNNECIYTMPVLSSLQGKLTALKSQDIAVEVLDYKIQKKILAPISLLADLNNNNKNIVDNIKNKTNIEYLDLAYKAPFSVHYKYIKDNECHDNIYNFATEELLEINNNIKIDKSDIDNIIIELITELGK